MDNKLLGMRSKRTKRCGNRLTSVLAIYYQLPVETFLIIPIIKEN